LPKSQWGKQTYYRPAKGQLINSLIHSLKEEDSELRFVENNFLAALTGQSTHEDLVQKSGLRRILFDKSCLRRIIFIQNLACGAFFS